MTERLITLLLALAIATGALLLLPPGPSTRLQSAVRYVTHPAQSWSDAAARISRAVLGSDSQTESIPQDGSAQNGSAKSSAEIARIQLEHQSSKATLEQMRWDLRLLGAHQSSYRHPFTVSVAKVIKRDPLVSYYDSVMIDSGATDGVKAGQYVVSIPAETGASSPALVGVVAETAATASRVMLVTHPGFAVPCGIPSRNITGVLRSPPRKPGLALEHQPQYLEIANPMGANYDAVREGDQVLTSGLGENAEGVANILVGNVKEKAQREDGMPVIRLNPSASLQSFSHVLVVLGAKKK